MHCKPFSQYNPCFKEIYTMILRHSDAQPWASECPYVKNYKWWLNPVWHAMLYSCTHMTTVGVTGLIYFLIETWTRPVFHDSRVDWCGVMYPGEHDVGFGEWHWTTPMSSRHWQVARVWWQLGFDVVTCLCWAASGPGCGPRHPRHLHYTTVSVFFNLTVTPLPRLATSRTKNIAHSSYSH